ncbi:hypothetical protein [Paenibacillus dakarensis]|uniref:hypothetical protein n=1 Tax=Paenibacillus dakarensis TaxID=1527293 RepID=UPI0009E81911|nr:hypothetical protein [Paenibacillus dakarensis]
MSCEITCPNFCPPVSPIVCEPVVIVRERFIPQIVPVIHPIKVVDKVHCVPVHHHIYKWENEEVRDVAVSGKASKKRTVRVSRARKKK